MNDIKFLIFLSQNNRTKTDVFARNTYEVASKKLKGKSKPLLIKGS